jgi:UDP-glucuronate 4-epimerase
LPSRRALVTGCAGFIGSHLTESLLQDGYTVLGVDCFNDNYARADKRANLARATDHDHFELLTADLVGLDADALLDGADVVFHLAGEPGVRASWGPRFDRYTHHNVRATQHLLEAARTHGDLKFVYASSSSIYGDALKLPTHEDETPRPLSPYGVTKLAAEHLCVLYGEEHGVDTAALRYFSVYGPRQRPDMAFRRFCEAIHANQPIEVYGDGRQTRDFTYVGDIVAATRAAAERETAKGRVYNIGGGHRTSLRCALEVLAGIAGRPLDIRHQGRESGDVMDTGADTTRARDELGFAPRTTLEDGLAAELDWVRGRDARASRVRTLTAS